MSFPVGEPVPWFYGPTEVNPRFCFDSVAGRHVVLCLFGSAGRTEGAAVLDGLTRLRSRFDDSRALFFGVTIDPDDDRLGRIRDQVPGIRFFRDFDQTISRLYRALPRPTDSATPDLTDPGMIPAATAAAPDSASVEEAILQYKPYSLILDSRLRVLAHCRFDEPGEHIKRIIRFLDRQPPSPEPFRAVAQAPVLIVPRIFEPELCRELVGLYDQHGGVDSGFMREVNGRTVPIIDYGHKRRADYSIEDEQVRNRCMHRIHNRLVPEIRQAFQFHATRMERYIVACYEASTGGHFRAHRDNTTRGTAHRRFAVSLNLNSEDFDGGDLRFPEFGPALYRPPTGGACVFSCSLLHEATPVTRGTRYVFLPFLYDDAAARLRAANARYLGPCVERPSGTPLSDAPTVTEV